MVTSRGACVGSRLARALELLGRSQFGYDDRGGLKSNSRNRLQQRALRLQLWIFLDVLIDFFLKIFNPALDLIKETAVCPANCFVICLIQSASGYGSSLSEEPAEPL